MSASPNSATNLASFFESRFVLFDVQPSSPGPRETPWLPIVVGIAAVAWYTLAATVAPYVADDSFILFRHVDNLLAGHGAIWDTAYPVEAHSSPLWVMLLAVGSTTGASLPATSVMLGIFFSAAAMMMMVVATRGLGSVSLRLALIALVATNPPVTTWANAGLEMPLALLVVVSFVWSISKLWQRSSPGVFACFVVCCFLSASIRPDLPLQLMACIVALALLRGAPRRTLLIGAASIVVGGVLLALWRYNVYGDYVALPQRAKSVIEPLNLLRYGRYVLLHGPLLVIAASSVAILWLRSPVKPRPVEVAAILLAGAIMSEHALLGGDELTRGRFTVQPLALLAIPLVRPLYSLAVARVLSICAIAGGLVVHAWFALHPLPDGDHLCGEAREEVGRWLAANSAPDFSIASTSAGYIPYYAERTSVDLYGLTHPDMASLTLRRGSTEYGYEVARIAGEEEVCGFIVPVCGSLPDATCPLPHQEHRLLAGIVAYLDRTTEYEAAVVELESKRNLILYVRDSCRDRLSGVEYCGAADRRGC